MNDNTFRGYDLDEDGVIDWLHEWKKMMCRQMKEAGPVCSDKHGTVINVSCDCEGCPYE